MNTWLMINAWWNRKYKNVIVQLQQSMKNVF